MHPELIKALIRIGGTTPAALAEELGVCRMMVSHVIHGRGVSVRVAERISIATGKSVAELWPDRYKTRARIKHGALVGVTRRGGKG